MVHNPTPAPAKRPVVYVYGGYGVSNAVSTRNYLNMREDQRLLYNNQYPVQPLVTNLENTKFTVITVDVLYNQQEPQKQAVANTQLEIVQSNPGQSYIYNGFSAGGYPTTYVANNAPEQTTALVF